MGNAGRDPVFWATLAVAEQDFDGSGDLCIRQRRPARRAPRGLQPGHGLERDCPGCTEDAVHSTALKN